MKPVRTALLASLLLGCADAVPPPAAPPEPPPPSPTVPPKSPPPPRPRAAPPVAKAPTETPVLEEPLPPLTRRFVTVTVRGMKGAITSVTGRGPKDLWLMSDEQPPNQQIGPWGAVYRFDGQRVTGRVQPTCAAMFYDVVVARNDAVVLAHNEWIRGVPPSFRTVLGKGKEPRCDFDWYASGFTVSSGEHVWELSCGREGTQCSLHAVNGPSATMPKPHASFGKEGESAPLAVHAFQMRATDEGWMIADDEDQKPWLMRYNGVVWTKVTDVDEGVEISSMWADGDGHVWLLAGHEKDGPGDMLYRLDSQGFHPVPVPKGFRATSIRGTGPRDVWFIGGMGLTVYQWDGARLRRGEAPWEIATGWAAPGGDLWVLPRTPEGSSTPSNVLAHTAPVTMGGDPPSPPARPAAEAH